MLEYDIVNTALHKGKHEHLIPVKWTHLKCGIPTTTKTKMGNTKHIPAVTDSGGCSIPTTETKMGNTRHIPAVTDSTRRVQLPSFLLKCI